MASLTDLVADLNAGKVDLLVIVGANPVYDAPADLDFLAAMEKAETRVRIGHALDETGRWCQWQVPVSHWLESWGDVRAHDGTVSLVQPLIEPLYRTRSIDEILAALAGDDGTSDYDLVRHTWLESNGIGGVTLRK